MPFIFRTHDCGSLAFNLSVTPSVYGHPRHSCIKDSKSVCEQSHMGSNPILSAKKVQ